jgi:hypothetical protein
MWFIDMFGEDDDEQFIRNVRIASTKSLNSSRNSPKEILGSFVLDLSFWEDSACNHNTKQTKKRRKSSRIASENTNTSSVSSRSKTMKNRDRSFARSNSQDSTDSLSKPVWKSAVDPSTGRTYYYDAITRKTQWSKVRESSNV